METPGKLLVFMVRRDTQCAECGCELHGGSMLTLRRDKGALCLSCADLDHLEFLGRGDAALTRRATRHSRLHAVVLQWSRTRQRYERQGILAETEALDRAEAECLVDEPQRAARRVANRTRLESQDRQFVAEFAAHIQRLYPGCPPDVAQKIAAHACLKRSGRVGRSAAAKQFEQDAIALAVGAYVRHRETNYDDLLMSGCDRHDAREQVRRDINRVLARWSQSVGIGQ